MSGRPYTNMLKMSDLKITKKDRWFRNLKKPATVFFFFSKDIFVKHSFFILGIFTPDMKIGDQLCGFGSLDLHQLCGRHFLATRRNMCHIIKSQRQGAESMVVEMVPIKGGRDRWQAVRPSPNWQVFYHLYTTTID